MTVSNVKLVQYTIFHWNLWASNCIKCVWSKGCR